jgi:hypothetical protein
VWAVQLWLLPRVRFDATVTGDQPKRNRHPDQCDANTPPSFGAARAALISPAYTDLHWTETNRIGSSCATLRICEVVPRLLRSQATREIDLRSVDRLVLTSQQNAFYFLLNRVLRVIEGWPPGTGSWMGCGLKRSSEAHFPRPRSVGGAF